MTLARDIFAFSGAALGAIVAIVGLAALFYRRALLPNLRADLGIEAIASDVKAARDAAEKAVHEVSTNGHTSATNTLKDDVRDARSDIAAMKDLGVAERERLAQKIDQLDQRSTLDRQRIEAKLDRHLEHSEMETHRVWAELRDIRMGGSGS